MQEDRYVQTIRELLHKKRFDHSLNVAQRAVELAKRYGEDEQKAYIAGILHDICKNMQPEEQLHWSSRRCGTALPARSISASSWG